MAASRRAQIQSLCGVRTGPLIDRVESYLAAVDIWSRRGNAKAVKNAGTGVVAICCYLAAESLDSRVPDRGAAIRASGLPPAQFAAAERDFRTAVQSVSSGSSQTLSGPSDVVNSAFAASLTATPTTRPIRPSPLAAPTSASKSKQALLAKAQAIQAGSLFDQTMRADTTSKSTSKAKATESTATASAAAAPSESTAAATPNAARAQAEAPASNVSPEMQPRRHKRRRMGKVVFGLAIHSSLNRLDEEEEANDERRRRNRILHIQSTIERLRSSDPTWRYLDSPRDFLVTISSAAEGASSQ
ncbi:uncharacterized protein UTRI_04968_B [Ustilago trichophora]|uniref:Uncharacterized protein n=1 Tax=Ustilago trichophora TaxID=86804 RepID=A0A5C3EE97_9BASI|nr:uncharacterized protein UTRI_04968_B [Ustilago trichophora]